GGLPVLQCIGVIPVDGFGRNGAKVHNRMELWTPQVTRERVALPNIDTGNEAQLGAKARRKVTVFTQKIEIAAGVGNVRIKTVALLRRSGRRQGATLRGSIKLLAQLRQIQVLPGPAM